MIQVTPREISFFSLLLESARTWGKTPNPTNPCLQNSISLSLPHVFLFAWYFPIGFQRIASRHFDCQGLPAHKFERCFVLRAWVSTRAAAHYGRKAAMDIRWALSREFAHGVAQLGGTLRLSQSLTPCSLLFVIQWFLELKQFWLKSEHHFSKEISAERCRVNLLMEWLNSNLRCHGSRLSVVVTAVLNTAI